MKVLILTSMVYVKDHLGKDHVFILQDRKVYDLPEYWALLLIGAEAAAEFIKFIPKEAKQ